MRILKCDRCGKRIKTSRYRCLNFIKEFGNRIEQFELCKECADDFDFDLGCMSMKYSKFKDKCEELEQLRAKLKGGDTDEVD